jgi:3-phenylpropionate/cinnamic acid dioxygenase small subunit
MNLEHVARVADLNARYADAIDADRLEAWPDFFLDDARYRITTALRRCARPTSMKASATAMCSAHR